MEFDIKFFEVEDGKDLKTILRWLKDSLVFDGTKYKVAVSIKEEEGNE